MCWHRGIFLWFVSRWPRGRHVFLYFLLQLRKIQVSDDACRARQQKAPAFIDNTALRCCNLAIRHLALNTIKLFNYRLPLVYTYFTQRSSPSYYDLSPSSNGCTHRTQAFFLRRAASHGPTLALVEVAMTTTPGPLARPQMMPVWSGFLTSQSLCQAERASRMRRCVVGCSVEINTN